MADFKYRKTFEFAENHRSYNNILPASNKILARKTDQARYEAHRARVSKAKHSIDNLAPKPYMHLHVKLKKLQTEEERLAVIERDNRMLLEKMSHIMRTQGQVDHRNYYEHKSLNYEQRHKEMLRITRENQKILDRIQARQPIISAEDLDEEYAQSAVYGENLSRYPKLEPIHLATTYGDAETLHQNQEESKQYEDEALTETQPMVEEGGGGGGAAPVPEPAAEEPVAAVAPVPEPEPDVEAPVVAAEPAATEGYGGGDDFEEEEEEAEEKEDSDAEYAGLER